MSMPAQHQIHRQSVKTQIKKRNKLSRSNRRRLRAEMSWAIAIWL
jgi:hypothetical protein